MKYADFIKQHIQNRKLQGIQMSELANLKEQNKKFRPVFTADSLELLISLVNAAPYEMRCLPESKKLIHYLRGFSFKIEHDMVAPSAILKPSNIQAPVPEFSQDIPAAKKSRLDMTDAELAAEREAKAAELDMYNTMKF